MFKKHEWTFLHYRYSQYLHKCRVWRVVILLMRAKYVGPARVNTQFQGKKRRIAECAYILYMQYVHCTLHIQHIYFYTHSAYIMKYIIKVQLTICIIGMHNTV